MSPLALSIGKELALQLLVAYATAKPQVATGLVIVQDILKARAAMAEHDRVVDQAQAEGWSDTDPRWDAPLAEQQARMDAVNARHDARE